jgi:hypothetical protein
MAGVRVMIQRKGTKGRGWGQDGSQAETTEALAAREIPEIILRVPGPWESVEEWLEQVPSGYEVSDFIGGDPLCGGSLTAPSGQTVSLFLRPGDQDFPHVFRSAASRVLTQEEFEQLQRAKWYVLVGGPGGDLAAAQTMLQMGTMLLDTGGFGVFLDSGARAHWQDDWRQLAEHRHDAPSMAWGYTSIVRGEGRFYSVGMHVLGHPDVQLTQTEDRQEDFEDLTNFMFYLLQTDRKVEDGHYVGMMDSRYFYEVQHQRDRRIRAPHPMHNPYGVWDMKPIPPATSV